MIKFWYYFDIMFSDSIPHHWAPIPPNQPHPNEGKYVFWRTINNYSNLLIFSFYYTIICTEYSDQVHRLNHRQNVVWLVSQLHIHVFIRLLHFWSMLNNYNLILAFWTKIWKALASVLSNIEANNLNIFEKYCIFFTYDS